MLPIDKGIPIPDPAAKKLALSDNRKYPWIEMEVGDSFLIRIPERGLNNWSTRIGWANSNYKPKRFVVRTLGPREVRIWRVA